MFLHLENNYEHPLELVSPKILCEALRSIKQVSGKSLFLTVGPSQMCIRKLNDCFLSPYLLIWNQNTRC